MGNREDAGKALASARFERREIKELPGGLPTDEVTAYRIQAAAIRGTGPAALRLQDRGDQP